MSNWSKVFGYLVKLFVVVNFPPVRGYDLTSCTDSSNFSTVAVSKDPTKSLRQALPSFSYPARL
ncbi:hypothetical protein [Microseira wollei]|uniref:Uncharacterized protein n=1 Tax=Microseira wollei NIES-4236 TaxID=2530354 RepID=A0AAV3XA48_9CYAN|nr:hypothetical protein [Microseira wollei]GET38263.1 hypothetical protein MiSe_30190 [Microseira wollei NIES-4236]